MPGAAGNRSPYLCTNISALPTTKREAELRFDKKTAGDRLPPLLAAFVAIIPAVEDNFNTQFNNFTQQNLLKITPFVHTPRRRSAHSPHRQKQRDRAACHVLGVLYLTPSTTPAGITSPGNKPYPRFAAGAPDVQPSATSSPRPPTSVPQTAARSPPNRQAIPAK